MFTKKALVTLLACFFFTQNILASNNDSQLHDSKPEENFLTQDTPHERVQDFKKSNRIPVALTTCLLIISGLTIHQAYATSNNQQEPINDVDTCKQNIAELQKDIAQSEKKENELTSEIQQLDERFNRLSDFVGLSDLLWEIRYANIHAENQREMYRQRIKEQQKQLRRITEQCESKHQIEKVSKAYHKKSR
ncbi:hypothetical protein KBD08_03270 [Candidatus Babeliales bacterium]|nr:hypothetical protein [Candidatus Babeliales bacterium]